MFLADGVCGCFNQEKDGLKADTDSSINIAEILAEESKSQVLLTRFHFSKHLKSVIDFVTIF